MNMKTNRPRVARSLATTTAIAFFNLIVLILIVVGGLAIYLNYLTYQDALSAQQLLIAQDAGKTVVNSIEEKYAGLETAIEFANPVSAAPNVRENFMASLLGIHPAFRQFALLDGGGQQLAQISRVSPSLSAQFTRQLEGDSLTQTAEGQRYISPVYIDDTSSEPLVAIAIPVKNVLGDFQGTLVAEVDLKFMWDLVDQLRVGETGYAYVVDNQGNLIAYEDASRVLANENVGQIPEVKEFLENPSEAGDITPEVASYTGLTGKTVLGSYVPLGSPQWAIFIELPTAEANQPMIQMLVLSIAGILVLAFLTGLVGAFMARRLAAPLVGLSNTANEVAGGNLAVEAKVAGPAEIAQVASAFNAMTSRLRDLIGSLEQRVADRTAALATSTEVSRRLSTILDQKELVSAVVNEVKNAFDYYHVHIYLYDEKQENLVMAGGTGEAGQTMLNRQHKMLRGRGLVGRAAETNQVVLVADTRADPGWLPNPLLPDTRSEVAVPIAVGEQVLGVLDVQHNVAGGLSQQDSDLLLSIANQVAIAVQNTRLFSLAQREAEREAAISVIGQKIQAATSVEAVLQTALRELSSATGAQRAGIQIGLKDTQRESVV